MRVPAMELRHGDVLLDQDGKPAFKWPGGPAKRIVRIEHVVRVVFEDYRQAEWDRDHLLDVERA